jgi:hypothetical protein
MNIVFLRERKYMQVKKNKYSERKRSEENNLEKDITRVMIYARPVLFFA